MKLTIKQNREIISHIAHGVEIEILNYECDYVGIKRAKANGYYYLNDIKGRKILHITYEGGSTGKSLNECRLILHNLSDLTKQIEHNGEKFVPLEYLWFETIGTDSDGFDRDDFETVVKYSLDIAPYKIIQKLLEWHFDIHDLIKNNLAIDINTIK